jgi:broad specificity phosphatase PhoE
VSAARFLYLARHAEADAEGNGLSERGRKQAALLAERLKDVPLTRLWHGPLPRAEQTARIVADRLGRLPCAVAEEAGDYVPHAPTRGELPAELADLLLKFLGGVSEQERAEGAELARRATEVFTGPVDGSAPRHELVVTHAFLVAWLVRAAMDAPRWRWLGLNVANAALTVIRYAPGRPQSVLLLNDQSHLPLELRWTGFPAELRV